MIKGITYLIEVEHQFYFYSKHQKKNVRKRKKYKNKRKKTTQKRMHKMKNKTYSPH